MTLPWRSFSRYTPERAANASSFSSRPRRSAASASGTVVASPSMSRRHYSTEQPGLLVPTRVSLLRGVTAMSRAQLFAAFFFAAFLYLLYQFYLVFHFFLTPL